VAALQLTTAFVALRYAVERELAVDTPVLHREGRDVARDSWFLGTGITPPLMMMAAQACAVATVAVRPSRVAARTLGILGSVMVIGYVAEQETRRALTPARWDSRVTPLTAIGLGLAVPMAAWGLRDRS
jgi:hypothetical protein